MRSNNKEIKTMKKFLLVSILLPLLTFGQTNLAHSVITGAPYNVGDEVIVKFEILTSGGEVPTLLQFDYEYNNKLLEKVSHTFDPGNVTTGLQSNLTHWDGYKYVPAPPGTGYSESNLRGQYLFWSDPNTTNYTVNSDWSIERVTAQTANTLPISTPILYVTFKIKDRQGTGYSDYSNLTHLNWSRLTDNRGLVDVEYNIQAAAQSISIENVGNVNAGSVTLNIDVPHSNKDSILYEIYTEEQFEGQSVIEGEEPTYTGYFDANGQATLTELVENETYLAFIAAYPGEWLDDVVTVTDVYKIFQYSTSTDLNGEVTNDWEYFVQDILGEVTNDETVNFDDSYELLAHINGVQTSANVTSAANGSFNISGRRNTFGVPDLGFFDKSFKPLPNFTSFTFAHGLRGDVDFSHSTTPTNPQALVGGNGTAKIPLAVSNNKTVTENLEISSKLENGKVVVEVNLDTDGLVGAQFKVKYDESILTLDDIQYDTGNAMPNFGTVNNSVASFGSLDTSGQQSINIGIPYRLVFTSNEPITNTIGLVSFKIVEGVKVDGTKVKFQY